MTEGSIFRHLLEFAFPLLIGNIFQQLYNMVDSWVVGNYVSNEAYAAVGTVGPIINTLIGFFMGLSSGAGVVISQYFGAKRADKVHDTVHTAMMMTLILAILFTGVGIVTVPFMLNLIDMPEEVIPEATTYLVIYFAGVIGLMFYNIGSGILRAVGDSTRPFLFLVVSAVLNTCLDLLFVLKFHMGVAGVAYATIFAQAVSAALVIITLMRSKASIRFRIRDMRIDWEMLGKIVKVGFPAALQMAITAFSNVFVQSYINYFETDFMSGWTAYNKMDQLIWLPMQSLALAATTFVGQNLGMGKVERAKKGVRKAFFMALVCTAGLIVGVVIFAPTLVSFFNKKPEVVEYGTMLLRYLSPFYILCCLNQIYAGALRGAGQSRAPMLIMIGSFVVFRQCYLYIMSHYIANEMLPIAMSYPAGWLVCSAAMLLYYHNSKWEKACVVEREQPAEE
ncbi:MAG: MATE family efflux transporter [Ruminococcus sp.]|nr:MATE family efflux transporter [Candidatus Apopatosoma intestinale]